MVKDHFKQIYKSELKELSNKYSLPVEEIINIYFNQFKFIIEQIRKDGDLPINQRKSIKIANLGTITFHLRLASQILKIEKDEQPKPFVFSRTKENT
jgi:hypothetical protein